MNRKSHAATLVATARTCRGIILVFLALPLLGQAKEDKVTASRIQVGTMKTALSATIALNKESTLPREAITIHDGRLPAALAGDVPITAYYSSEYYYRAHYDVTPSEPVAAIEVRFILFDVFGDRLKVLSTTEVTDMPTGVSRGFDSRWRILSENEASEYYASIAFVARVRTQAGRVVNADLAPVVAEATKFSKRFTAADLEPKPPEKR